MTILQVCVSLILQVAHPQIIEKLYCKSYGILMLSKHYRDLYFILLNKNAWLQLYITNK